MNVNKTITKNKKSSIKHVTCGKNKCNWFRAFVSLVPSCGAHAVVKYWPRSLVKILNSSPVSFAPFCTPHLTTGIWSLIFKIDGWWNNPKSVETIAENYLNEILSVSSSRNKYVKRWHLVVRRGTATWCSTLQTLLDVSSAAPQVSHWPVSTLFCHSFASLFFNLQLLL